MSPIRKPHFARQEFISISKDVGKMLADGYTKIHIYQHFYDNATISMTYRTFSRYVKNLHLPSLATSPFNLAASAKPALGGSPMLNRATPKGEATQAHTHQATPDVSRLLKLHNEQE